jgi:hypothetical protein
MKSFIAIVGVSDGRVTKYADFDTLADANAHAVKFGGFTHETLDGPIGYWVVDGNSITLDTDQEAADILAAKWARIRAERDALLAASDYTQVADAPGDTAAWATYRQALRDVPTATSPDDVVWPTEPN